LKTYYENLFVFKDTEYYKNECIHLLFTKLAVFGDSNKVSSTPLQAVLFCSVLGDEDDVEGISTLFSSINSNGSFDLWHRKPDLLHCTPQFVNLQKEKLHFIFKYHYTLGWTYFIIREDWSMFMNSRDVKS